MHWFTFKKKQDGDDIQSGKSLLLLHIMIHGYVYNIGLTVTLNKEEKKQEFTH